MPAQNHIPTERPTPKIPSTAQLSELERPIISLLSKWILTTFAFPTPAGLEDNLETRTVHLKGEGGTMLAWASVSFPVCSTQVQWALGYQGRTILTSCGLFPNPEDNAVPLGHQVLLPPPPPSLHRASWCHNLGLIITRCCTLCPQAMLTLLSHFMRFKHHTEHYSILLQAWCHSNREMCHINICAFNV